MIVALITLATIAVTCVVVLGLLLERLTARMDEERKRWAVERVALLDRIQAPDGARMRVYDDVMKGWEPPTTGEDEGDPVIFDADLVIDEYLGG